MIITGIDEAGLGPVLGPYCAAGVSIEKRNDSSGHKAMFSEQPEEGKLAVGDSKKIFSPGKLDELEKTVLSMTTVYIGSCPGSVLDFFKAFQLDKEIENIPWYQDAQNIKLPLSGCSIMQDVELPFQIKKIFLTLKSASSFNALLDKYQNKASVCQDIISPILKESAQWSDQLVVDRQGGRRYYGDWLLSLFPGKRLIALKELKALSSYEVDSCLINFEVKADASCFETALASMFAKYCREICMEAFNLYWSKQVPGIKKTAGYYTDGNRFFKELKSHAVLPDNQDLILRKK